MVFGPIVGRDSALGGQDGHPRLSAQPQPAAGSGKGLPQAAPAPVDLSRVADNLNRFLQSNQRNLNFHVDESSGRTIITVVNPETGEIVRQIPPEEMVMLARRMRVAGLVFDALA